MSTPPGYGPSSGIPGGDDFDFEAESKPEPRPAPAGSEPEPRSRPIDSGIPAPSLDELVVGPVREFLDEPAADPDADPSLIPDDADRPPVDRGVAALLLLLGAAVVLLVVAAQASVFLTTLASWPPMLRAAGYAVAALLGLMFAVSLLGLAWRYLILPVTPGVRLNRADDLAHRRSAQLRARRNVSQAKRLLRQFLRRYPSDARQRRFLASIAGPERADHLLAQRDRLLEHDPATDADWVLEFEDRVLGPLDELAALLVTRHAVAVGWKTAVVPTGFLDGLIVVANAYHLVGQLCRLYHLRADSWSTLKITAHLFANAFVAGRLEDLTDHAADETFNQMHDLIHSQVARAVFSRLSSGVAQGTVNALLLRRFGRLAVRALRPVRR